MSILTKTLKKSQAGATMVEYALMLALIALVAAIGAAAVGVQTNNKFECIEEKLKDPNHECE